VLLDMHCIVGPLTGSTNKESSLYRRLDLNKLPNRSSPSVSRHKNSCADAKVAKWLQAGS
jgi:hypothetical protein